MHFEELGDITNPTLVCVPGLFGGPTDFAGMRDAWAQEFHVILLDPDRDRRKSATATLPVESEDKLFVSTSDAIAEILKSFDKKDAFVVGISLGSKVVFDFAIKYPWMFKGGLSLDVGCGPFEDTDLYKFIDGLVDHLDLTIPFSDMKKILQERIPDRNLRTMIQTQLFYPGGKPPARWKAGMRHLGNVLSDTMKQQKIDVQFDGLERVDKYLADRGCLIKVLKATSISAISEECMPRMRALSSVWMEIIEGSSHFLHATHKDLVTDEVLRMGRRRKLESAVEPQFQT